MNIQDARRSLAKWLNEEPNAPVDRAALAAMLAEYDRIAAIRDGLGKAQEPVGRVLAEDEMGIGYDRRMGDVIWFSGRKKPGFLYQSPPADSAQALVEALRDAERYRILRLYTIRGVWEEDIRGPGPGLLAWAGNCAGAPYTGEIIDKMMDDLRSSEYSMARLRPHLAAHKSEGKG